MGGSRFMLPAGGFIGVPVLFPARVWGASWELWLCRLAAWVRCRIRLCPLARTLHERAPLFHEKCPPLSCTPPHPFAEAPPAPPETGAMPPPDMTNVPAQHYSCFPPTLLMFPLNMTNVSPQHYSCFRPARPPLRALRPAGLADCPGISAPRLPRPPEPSPCTVTALGRFSPAARAGAGRGVWYNPADGLMLAEMRLRRLRAGGR